MCVCEPEPVTLQCCAACDLLTGWPHSGPLRSKSWSDPTTQRTRLSLSVFPSQLFYRIPRQSKTENMKGKKKAEQTMGFHWYGKTLDNTNFRIRTHELLLKNKTGWFWDIGVYLRSIQRVFLNKGLNKLLWSDVTQMFLENTETCMSTHTQTHMNTDGCSPINNSFISVMEDNQ